MRLWALGVVAIASIAGAVVAYTQTQGPNLEALKAQYRRPAAIPTPADNPLTEARVALGQTLFYDPRLSGGNGHSCASCHVPALGWEDGRALGSGEPGTPLARHTPTLWNLAWEESFFWDGRAATLEQQAEGPIEDPREMNQPMTALVAELAAIPGYAPLFAAAFGTPTVTKERIVQSLAVFQRTLVSPETAFDRWVAGDADALSEAAVRGFAIFHTTANCAACHSGWAFTDRAFHDIGLPDEDLGRGAVLDLPEINHGFKTPTLRDIGRRAPYMHDGSIDTLEAVIEHYETGFVDRPTLSEDMQPITLSEEERQDLLAFLRSLDSDTDVPQATPPELPQ